MNEMTNQAAQTMPELPPASAFLHNMAHNPLYTAAQMHQYARDYAAALSQTAGVPEGWPRDWRWAVQFARSVIDTERECREPIGRDRAQYTRTMNVLDAMLSAAPAASGRESAASLSSNPNPVTPSLSSESAASVSERARDDLHVAICQAVALMNMEPMTTTGLLQAHDILRKAIS